MKILSSFFFLFSLALTMPAQAFLTPDESQQVLNTLNETCGDNWCEGVYDIQFTAIRCSRHNRGCLLTLRVADSYEEKAIPKNYSCLLEPLNSAAEILNPTMVGLTVDFTSIVTKCIDSFKP